MMQIWRKNRMQFLFMVYMGMLLTVWQNIRQYFTMMMKMGNMPFHGAMVKILLQGNKEATILLMGDTGAGKSETLEAFRVLADKYIRQLTIIADDMGSIELDSSGY